MTSAVDERGGRSVAEISVLRTASLIYSHRARHEHSNGLTAFDWVAARSVILSVEVTSACALIAIREREPAPMRASVPAKIRVLIDCRDPL